jgi:hypothetical protein
MDKETESGRASWIKTFHKRPYLGHVELLLLLLLELGTSLFEIALSLFALERTLILGAMALLETKSEAL